MKSITGGPWPWEILKYWTRLWIRRYKQDACLSIQTCVAPRKCFKNTFSPYLLPGCCPQILFSHQILASHAWCLIHGWQHGSTVSPGGEPWIQTPRPPSSSKMRWWSRMIPSGISRPFPSSRHWHWAYRALPGSLLNLIWATQILVWG